MDHPLVIAKQGKKLAMTGAGEARRFRLAKTE